MSIREPNDAGGDADKYNDLDAEYLEGCQDAAYDAAVEAGMFDPEINLGATILNVTADFMDAHGLHDQAERVRNLEPVRQTDAERESQCAGPYSLMATNGRAW